MFPVFAILITTVAIALSSMLFNVRGGLDAFNNTAFGLQNMATSALAGATFTSKKSNALLANLAQSIELSLEGYITYCTNEEGESVKDRDCLEHLSESESVYQGNRVSRVKDFIRDINDFSNNGIASTLEFGFNGGVKDLSDKKKLHKEFKFELLNSQILPPKTKDQKKLLASTLVSKDRAVNQALVSKVVPETFYTKFLTYQGGVFIDKRLLKEIIQDNNLVQLMVNNQNDFGLIISENSNTAIGFHSLPNGIKADITVRDLSKKEDNHDKTEHDSEDKIVTEYGVAQLRIDALDIESDAIIIEGPEVDPDLCQDGSAKDAEGRCACPLNRSLKVFNLNQCPLDCSVTGTCPTDCRITGTCSTDCRITNTCPVITEEELFNLGIDLTAIPSSSHGVLVDPNDPSRIIIVNKKNGGFTSVGINDEGFLDISIGGFPGQKHEYLN